MPLQRVGISSVVLVLALSAAAPAVEVPPALPLSPLASAPLAVVQTVDSPAAVTVRRDDDTLTVRLACVRADGEEPAGTAADFLRRLLVGETVWLVPAASAGQAASEDGGGSACYLIYRWPDRLLVNVELVRLGYADAAVDGGPEAAQEVFRYWRDRAREQHKGIWGPAATTLPAPGAPAAVAPTAANGGSPATQRAATGEPTQTTGNRPPTTDTPSPEQEKTIVYITNSGTKYHREHCPSLRKSKKAIPLAEARASYEPCKTCNPPQ